MKKITSLRRLAVALLVSGVSLHAAAQAYADRTIRVGHQAQPDAPISQAARKFAELVAEKSGGRLKVKEFPASQLGNEAQQLGGFCRCKPRIDNGAWPHCISNWQTRPCAA